MEERKCYACGDASPEDCYLFIGQQKLPMCVPCRVTPGVKKAMMSVWNKRAAADSNLHQFLRIREAHKKYLDSRDPALKVYF